MNPVYCYVATRNGLFISEDLGLTWTQIVSDINTSELVDIAINKRYLNQSLIISGDGIATTPYLSSNDLENYTNGINVQGKEVNFISDTSFVIAGKNRASSSGSEIFMTFDGGQTIGRSFDVASLFNYPGAIFNNITVMAVDFPNITGGYIAIAGDNNNSADQILTRTYDQGVTFPDAVILPHSTYGIIRAVWVSPEYNIVFASGEPDSPTGKLYSINPSLTEYPVEVLSGVTVGETANNRVCRFASVPPVFPTPENTEYRLDEKESVYFLDSAGNVYFSADRGITWDLRGNATRTGDCVDIIAINLTTVLVLGNSPAAVYKSVDGGVTFTQIAQPTWINPRAITISSEQVCETCPNFYENYLGSGGTVSTVCARNPLNGPICKSPYIYNQIFEACATPSTIEPTNLLISIDRSGSVTSDERDLLHRYISLLFDKIGDRLADGSIKVGIVQWSSLASFSTPFSSDIDFLKLELVRLDDEGTCGVPGCSGGQTDQKRAFCLSFEVMHNQSVSRPNAANVIMHFTDGRHAPQDSSVCDLTNIGITTVSPSSATFDCIPPETSMYTLVNEAKTALNNGTGVEIYVVALGQPNDIQGVEDFAITRPSLCASALIDVIPTRQPVTNNPYFFRAGSFEDAEFIADQLRIGLSSQIIPTIQCPDECPGVPGIDNLGYCECREEFQEEKCAVKITNCITNEEVIIQNISPFYYGKYVTLRDSNAPNTFYGEGCWLVTPVTFSDITVPTAIVNTSHPDCPSCSNPPWFSLTDCLDDSFVIYTQNNTLYLTFIGADNVILHPNYPDRCLRINSLGSANTYVESGITAAGITRVGPDCSFCPRESAINYKLTDCNDELNIIYCEGITNDLQQYISQYVNLQGFGDTCWLVEIDTEIQNIYQDVTVTNSYADCIACTPVVALIYEFVNCEDDRSILATNSDFSQYDGQVVRLQEYPGNCWTCNLVNTSLIPTQNLTVDGEAFTDCPECLTTFYQLTNCVNSDVFFISPSTELARYFGRTITAAGFPSLCFTVTEPKCDCVRIVVNNIEYDVNKAPAGYNGKNLYLFEVESGDRLGLAWNINPDRWELFNTQTLEAYGFTNRDSECPFSNFWTTEQGSPYIISSVTFCVDRIYNIAPELDFDNCDPCIKCI